MFLAHSLGGVLAEQVPICVIVCSLPAQIYSGYHQLIQQQKIYINLVSHVSVLRSDWFLRN